MIARDTHAPLRSASRLRRARASLGLLAGFGLVTLMGASALAAPGADAAAAPSASPVPVGPAPDKPAPEQPKKAAESAAPKKAVAPAPTPTAAPAPSVANSKAPSATDNTWLDGEDGVTVPPEKPAAAEPAPAPVNDAAPAPAPETQAKDTPAATENERPHVSVHQIRYVIPPPTEPVVEAPPEDYNTLPFTYHQLHWDLSAAVRVSFLDDAGYDFFSENDTLTQVSLSAGRALYANDRFSVAVAGLFEMGGSSATTRGMDATYLNQRFGLSFEARYHVWHWLYGYVRVAPAAMRGVATLSAPTGTSYETDVWGASVDGAAGLALRLFGSSNGEKPGPRFFLFAEGGYGLSQTQDLSLSPSGSVVPDRAESLDLGTLDASGAMMRIGAMLTF